MPTTTHLPSQISRFPLSELAQLTTANSEVEIGTECIITPYTQKDDLLFSSYQKIQIKQYITLRFGYWKEVSTKELATILKIKESSIIVNDWNDDDCGAQFNYMIPTTTEIQNIILPKN